MINPDTEKMELVQGRTSDGLDVFAPYELNLILCDVCRWDNQWFGFVIEFNEDAKGKRLPYYVIGLGKLRLTGGWLFDADVFGAPKMQREPQLPAHEE